ncbi:2-oxoglutarate dehydrogenase complex dihydrolipoyllysine-residue succinyltransferase [Anaerolineales bacterium HSG25]|nr:2-oxoglutarate dehydrogenase complex dihydrolipoyllysine-residue succinyltransferase [Anaerolineales bacterium HSG25]
MTIEIRVPTLAESVVEATVGQWLKQAGDTVSAGEALVELETDKVNLEVSAEQAGVLVTISAPEGADVVVGDLLGMLDPSGDVAAPSAPSTSTTAPSVPTPPAPPVAPVPAVDVASASTTEEKATPVAKKVAQAHGVDLAQVSYSGSRITKDDVRSHVTQQQVAPVPAPPPIPTAPPAPVPQTPALSAKPVAPPASSVKQPASHPVFELADRGREERVRLSRRRQTIAKRLVEAQQTAAMLTTFNEIDMSAVMDIRKRRKENFVDKHGVRLGFMSFFVKAVVSALKAFPPVNASIDGSDVIYKQYYDIGIAVGAKEGLVVPVLRDADRRNFAQIEGGIVELANRAKDGSLSLADLQGGTFTVTNGGVFGSMLSTPILNPPQVGILGLHKIEQRPIALNGEVVIRPMMYVALSYDHRIIDGREAVQFLVHIKSLMEDPETMLLEG